MQPYQKKGSLDEVIKKSADYTDFGQPPKLVLRFKTCPDEDKKVIQALEQWFAGHPNWDLFLSNCADAAKCGLRSVSISTGHQATYSTPQELARYLYNAYGSQKDKVTVVSGDWLQYTKDNGTAGVIEKKSDSILKSFKGKIEAVIQNK